MSLIEGQKKMEKNDPHNSSQKIKDWATRTHIKQFPF